MKFNEDDLEALLEERVAGTTRTQMVAWAAGSLERSYSLRLAEIEAVLKFISQSGHDWAASTTDSRPVSRGVRRRLSAAVDQYFDDLETHVDDVTTSIAHDEDVETDMVLPQEQLLIMTYLLVGGEEVDGFASNLTGQIHDAAELDVVEELLGERLSATRSSVVFEGLLVAAMSALEDLVLPLLRLGLMTTEGFQQSELDDAESLRRLVRDAKASIKGGPPRWREAIREVSGLDPAAFVADWSLLVEAHLRRNTIVHNGGRVDFTYMKNRASELPRPGLGEVLRTDHEYIGYVLAGLRAVGVGMTTLWPVLLSEEPSPRRLTRPNRAVVHLLHGGHWGDAYALATALAPHEADEATRGALRVNAWMATRQIAGSVDTIRDEVEGWTPPNSSISWEIGRAALLEQHEDLRALLRRAADEGNIFTDYASWPLLKEAAARDTSIRALVYRQRRQRRVPK